MFGQRNYSRYSISNSGSASTSLSDAVKVNKLQDSQLSVYFNSLKHRSCSKDEILKRNSHFEEFKKAVSSRKTKGILTKKFVARDDRNSEVFNQLIKRYRVQPVKDDIASKPAIRRAPLRTIKTISIEVPSVYKEQAIYTIPKKKSVETFVEIVKPIRREQKKKTVEIVEEPKQELKKPPQLPPTVIEQQLKETRHEIDMATTQLEQIRSLLNQRKKCLTPVQEEMEEVEEKANLVRDLVDKKSSPIHPRTQWTVKSWDTDRTTQKKNKLMSTLNKLNQRLQKIQEKYFNEPKVKYKSISDFIPPRSKETIETLYRNEEYGKEAAAPDVLKIEPEEQPAYDHETMTFMSDLIKRTQKKTKVNVNRSLKMEVTANDSILVLLPPKGDFMESDANVKTLPAPPDYRDVDRGILKRNVQAAGQYDTVLEAPRLQESIIKSDFLMKEFNLSNKDKDFDLAKILMAGSSRNTSTENLRKNVRFSQQLKKEERPKENRLYTNISVALRNSLFYQDEQKPVM